MLSIYTFTTAVILISFLSSSTIVSAQEFFATVENDFVNAFPLNKCVSKDSNSMIYRFHNGTHAVQKIFTGNTSCDESFLNSQTFMDGYYTNLQSLINDHIAYRTYSYDTTCTDNFLYTFFKDKDCLKSYDYYYSITVLEDKLIEIVYQPNNVNDMCNYDNFSGTGSVFYENRCVPYGPNNHVNTFINHDKIQQCEENATDSVGIILVFLFMCLILF